MNYSALSNSRAVVFDPCVPAGAAFLSSFHDFTQSTELLGLTETNTKADGCKLIRGPLAESFKALTTIGACFDVIVSAPASGATVPVKGMPKPNVLAAPKPTGRRLFVEAEEGAPNMEPVMDLGYAAFLMANALMSPQGEALLAVGPESLALIEKDLLFSRVWAVESPLATDETARTVLYVARDHKPLPGSTPASVLNQYSRSAIRGSTVSRTSQNNQSLRKFKLVRDELQRRASLTETDWNIYLENNTVRVRYDPFLYETDLSVREIADKLDSIRHKTLVDLAVMRDTRDQVRGFLRHPKLRVPPGLVTAFDEICKQMTVLTAPFNRPSPVQRVAWLDEQNGIECTANFAGFEAGKSYPVRTQVFTGKKTEMRHRPGHKNPEEVLVTGQEVLVSIRHPGTYEDHAFTQFPITEESDLARDYWRDDLRHSLSDLLQHFKMPDVQDIAEADPTSYLKFTDRLRKLETV